MNSLIIILFLSIYNSILFHNNQLGLSVILFIVPLIIFITYFLKNKNLIKNKKGLLFIIPIILLSVSYLIFTNNFFYYTNLLIIPVLFLLMFIFTIKPSFNLKDIIENILYLVINPLTKFSDVSDDTTNLLKEKIHISENNLKIIKSFAIAIPIIIVVLILLTQADMIFDNLITKIITLPKEIFKNFDLIDFIWRIFLIIILFMYLSGTMYYLSKDYLNEQKEEKTKKQKDSTTIIILLITLNIIYVIFDIIQIKSLMLHSVGTNINYAEYARQGFFQLMFVSFINIIIILKAKQQQDKKLINILSLIMVSLTLIIIISSILRMNLYEAMYGYTLLRLLVYIILFTEIILIIPLVIYIINNKFNLTKTTIIIITIIYTFINFINLDSIIAKRNIQRYYQKNDIDIKYLENYSTDNINDLINLYDKTNDKEIKESLNYYFKNLDTSYNFREFNISKYNAKNKLKTIK